MLNSYSLAASHRSSMTVRRPAFGFGLVSFVSARPDGLRGESSVCTEIHPLVKTVLWFSPEP